MTFGDIQITKMFLERNANPNARCKFDITPFSLAVQEAPIEIIQLLFEHGASINAGQPLHYAVRRKSNDRSVVIQSLISKGACVNAVMFQDHLPSFYHFESLGLGTALHSAARYGDRQAVQLLLESGADPSIKDTRNQLPIQLARLGNHMEIVKMLEGWVDRGQRL
jgi:ankyrin repeat protein